MSDKNIGNQKVYIQYDSDLVSKEFNKLFKNVIQQGLYNGGEIEINSNNDDNDNNTVNIAPMDVMCYTSEGQALHIVTNETIRPFPISKEKPYVVCNFI
jgi:hypothetical protein